MFSTVLRCWNSLSLLTWLLSRSPELQKPVVQCATSSPTVVSPAAPSLGLARKWEQQEALERRALRKFPPPPTTPRQLNPLHPLEKGRPGRPLQREVSGTASKWVQMGNRRSLELVLKDCQPLPGSQGRRGSQRCLRRIRGAGGAQGSPGTDVTERSSTLKVERRP